MNPNNLPIKEHKTAGCVLYFKEDAEIYVVLIYKYWSDDNFGYFVPKGHIEADETKEQAAVRESIEETGFQNLTIKSFITEQHISYPWNDGFWHEKSISWFPAEIEKNYKKELKLTETEIHVQQRIETFQIDEAIQKNLSLMVTKKF